MRFPRNAKIFRGQLDAAPLAGVFFLLVIFLLLASLLYTPGTPIQFSSNTVADVPRKNVSITKAGKVLFENRTYPTNLLEQLRDVFKNLAPETTLVLNAEPGAPRQIISQVQQMADVLSLRLDSPGVAIELPSSQNSIGTDEPTVIVAVNLAGQFFFENQLITAPQLKLRLTTLAKESPAPLTLVVLADKNVKYGVVQNLVQLAEEVGIKKGLSASRPISGKRGR